MLKFRHLLILLLFCLSTSCTAYKKIPYIQTIERVKPAEIESEAKIVINDKLTIVVSASDPMMALPFNAMRPTLSGTTSSNNNDENYMDYVVDSDGNISFPILGKLNVLNKTTSEVSNMIVEKLADYLVERPVVSVKISDFKVTVLGEVKTPGVLLIESGKINIFEALAMAGDMTLYGQRYDVKLIREVADGKREVVSLDLRDVDVVDTPYYYLCQNDVVYVSPNKTQGNASAIGTSKTIWFTVASTMMSIVSIILAVTL